MFNSPRERAKTVTLDLLSDKTLPNIILGAHLTAWLQLLVGMITVNFVLATGVTWVVSVLVYAWIDEIKQKIEEAERRTLSEESSYYGIE